MNGDKQQKRSVIKCGVCGEICKSKFDRNEHEIQLHDMKIVDGKTSLRSRLDDASRTSLEGEGEPQSSNLKDKPPNLCEYCRYKGQKCNVGNRHENGVVVQCLGFEENGP